MICPPCRDPHSPNDCVDAAAGRSHEERWCYCQHKPRRTSTVVMLNTDEPVESSTASSAAAAADSMESAR